MFAYFSADTDEAQVMPHTRLAPSAALFPPNCPFRR